MAFPGQSIFLDTFASCFASELACKLKLGMMCQAQLLSLQVDARHCLTA